LNRALCAIALAVVGDRPFKQLSACCALRFEVG
jgi:hypothetical protein